MPAQAAKKPPKAARKPVGRPFVKGDPRINRTIPGPGRPPEAFQEMCRSLACSAEAAAAIALQDSTHPAFIGALKWATEHGYGKPKETHEHTGKDGAPIQVMIIGGREVKF